MLLAAAKGRITLNLDLKSPIYAEVVGAVLRAGGADLGRRQGKSEQIGAIAERQTTGAHPLAFELPRMASEDVAKMAAVGQRTGVRLFSNTLGDGFVARIGGGNDALPWP